MIASTKSKDGWKNRSHIVHGETQHVIVAPDGTRYVLAHNDERADLVVKEGGVRLRTLVTQGGEDYRTTTKKRRTVKKKAA